MRQANSKKARNRNALKRTASRNFRPLFERLEDRLALATVFGLTGTDTLIQFDSATPGTLTSTPITGVNAGESLVGIDFRPQNGFLYGLGVNAAGNTATLYSISARTGVAAAVGAAGSIAFTDGTNPIDLPDPATVGYGFDFNPAADRVRVVAGSLNLRVNPNTGGPVDGDGNAANGINPDGAVNTGTTTVDATAYTNSQANTTVTTQYTLDASSNSLFIQNPPNTGTQTLGQVITFGGNPLDFSSVNGFDIPNTVIAPMSNAPVATGSAFAALNVGGTTGLYSINLVNGQSTLVGTIGAGSALKGLAVQSTASTTLFELGGNGTVIIRSSLAQPNAGSQVTIAGVDANETVVGIDLRPQTGQLYGLGVNDTANTATVYLIDPQTGAATAVGAIGQVAFVTTGGTPVDLPAASAGYGFDFNPTVDRIRVTTSTGLNFRVNPNNGAPADTDANAGNGINPDGNINGSGVTGVSATAYTNSFGQSLTGGVTTQYTIDATTNSLYIQNPPNAGTETVPLPITLNGATLDFDNINGFDIPSGVRVTTSTAPAVGFGIASLNVAGVSTIFSIDLSTGVATQMGPAATSLSGLTLGDLNVAGTFQFGAPTFTVDESAGTATITVTRTGGSDGTATVNVATSNGTATSPADFADSDQVLTFGPGVSTQTFTIAIVDDGAIEADETVNLALSNATGGAALGTQATAVLTITSDDVAPPQSAGTAVLVGDVLSVLGTSKSESIVIKPVKGQVQVFLNGRKIGSFSPDDIGSIEVNAGAGNDSVVIATSLTFSATVNGEDGNDSIVSGNGSDFLFGGPGKDTLVGNGGDDEISGDDGNDVLKGGAGDDTMTGGTGNDVMTGDGGNDTMNGDDGNDVVKGGAGDDTVSGDDGNDTVTGDSGNDTVSGGIGNDTVLAGSGDDTASGGEGNDVVAGESGNDTVTGDEGNDIVKGGSGNDIVSGGDGNDKVFGEAGNDFLLGGIGNDQLYGGAGRDIMVGGEGADTLYGDGGDDILVGGTTSADNDEAAAADIFAAWTANVSYNQRVADLADLNITIFDDGAVDTLFGQGNQDLFLADSNDKVKDKAKNEFVNLP